MRIERLLATLYAVLAAVLMTAFSLGIEDASTNANRVRHSHYHKNMEEEAQWKREMWLETRNTLRRESDNPWSECCPTEEELTTPVGGTNRDGLFVELYKDVNTTQIFYEYSCRKGVENQPCRYMDYRLYNISRCVQQFSYAYALVRDNDSQGTESPHERYKRKLSMVPANSGEGGWMMDHIKIRSGCSCQVPTSPDKKFNKKFINRGKSNEKMVHHKEKRKRKSKNDEP